MELNSFTPIWKSILIWALFLPVLSSVAQNRDSQSLPPLEIPKKIKATQNQEIELWIIRNLEYYGENQIQIFNRSGVLVFKAEPYLQNWPKQVLVDNKYFFLLDIGNERVSGWIEIESDPGLAKKP